MNLGDINVKKFGKDGDFLIKVEQKNTNNNLIPKIKKILSDNLNSEIDFRRVENVGPKVSSELLESSIIAISLALAAMLFYIWVRFEWQFSIGSILALFHDVVITLGVFSILSLEINLSIIAAVLTIVGYSMNDTVVIYDRIRENLHKYNKITISDIANLSINETLARTIITSITTLLALVSIYIFSLLSQKFLNVQHEVDQMIHLIFQNFFYLVFSIYSLIWPLPMTSYLYVTN